MKKLLALGLIAISLSLTACADRYTMEYKCVNGVLTYKFQKIDEATKYVYVSSEGVAVYNDTKEPVKCVER